MRKRNNNKEKFFQRFIALVFTFFLILSVIFLVEERKKATSELIISDSLPEIEEIPSGWLINLEPIIPPDQLDKLLGSKGVYLYILKNGLPFRHSKIKKSTNLFVFIRSESKQNDYSFFITDGRRTFTAEAPRTLGEPNPTQVNRVKYLEKEGLFIEILDAFSREIRQKLLNNLIYVVKKKPSRKLGGIVQVRLIRETLNTYKTQITFQDKNGLIQEVEVPLENAYVWIKFDEAFNKHAYLWDDSFISWFAIDTDPQLTASTLGFWYSLQIQSGENKGLIPRQVRPEQYAENIDLYHRKTPVLNPLLSIPLTSRGINNPFILGRVEIELYRKTKNESRLSKVLPKLIDYFQWVENHKKQEYIIDGNKLISYEWSNRGSGMDNSPRCKDNPDCGYVDLIAQQAALAKDIVQIATIINQERFADEFQVKYEELVQQIQIYYFDENSGFVYDILPNGEKIVDIETLAFTWSLYAKALTKKQVDKLVNKYLINKEKFGGTPLLPSLARDSLYFSDSGNYWRGGVWPPLIWVTYVGLTENGYNSLANKLARDYLELFRQSFFYYGSLFEYYSPREISPTNPILSQGKEPEAKSDFYGWGVLPLKLYFELSGK